MQLLINLIHRNEIILDCLSIFNLFQPADFTLNFSISMSGIHLHFFQSQVNIQLASFLKFLLSHVETEDFLSIYDFLRNQGCLNVVTLQMNLVLVIFLDCQILGVHGYVFILRLP